MNKYELHTHTKECDNVAQVGGAEIARLYKNAGYDGVVVTDHYFSHFYEWFKDDFDPHNHKAIIDRYLKGYYSARNEGEKIGINIFCGAEVRFDNTINDYLVYGLEEEDFYNLPLLNRLGNINELIDALPDYAVVVQAHPFRNNMTVCDPEPFFGIEGFNGCTDGFRNEMAKYYAKHFDKVLTSGSDFHCAAHLARGGIATPNKISSSLELIETLRKGDYFLIENGEIKKSEIGFKGEQK